MILRRLLTMLKLKLITILLTCPWEYILTQSISLSESFTYSLDLETEDDKQSQTKLNSIYTIIIYNCMYQMFYVLLL